MTPRRAAGLRGLIIDTRPLRQSPDFRVLWSAQLLTMVGRQLSLVALPYQIFLITRSSLAVGLVGLAQLLPLLAAGLYGGALADRHDRRRLLLAARLGSLACAASLAAMTLGRVPFLAALYVVAALAAGLYALEHATRSASVPRLVPEPLLPSALSLVQLLFQSAVVVGPALAGVAISRVGVGWAYALDSGLEAAALLVLVQLAPQPASQPVPDLNWHTPIDALGYLAGNRLLLGIFVADLNAMIFALPRALYPALATDLFRVGPTGLGLLYSAPGAGALVAVLLSGWVAHASRRGLLVIWSVGAWGAAIAAFGAFGLRQEFLPSLLMLGVAGAADMVSAVFRHTILQLSVPDSMRGRMSALNTMVVTLGPSLGDARAGVVATAAGPEFSVISGGLLCSVGAAAVALLMPELRRHRAGVRDAIPAA